MFPFERELKGISSGGGIAAEEGLGEEDEGVISDTMYRLAKSLPRVAAAIVRAPAMRAAAPQFVAARYMATGVNDNLLQILDQGK